MKLGIREKLFGSFSLVLILAVAIGVIGWKNTTELSGDFQALYTNQLVTSNELANAQESLDANEKQSVSDFQAGYAAYILIRQRVLALFDAGTPDQANAAITSEGSPALTRANTALNALQDIQVQTAWQAETSVAATAALSVKLLAGAVLLALVTAFVMTRGITRGVTQVQATVRRLRWTTPSRVSPE